MRPEYLEMQAFGSYAKNQIVDFRQLGSRQFFLVHGPTGAGKTTILDAICFALYGESSGNERRSRELRSDFASPDLPTKVCFEFRLGAKIYRIERLPEQELSKKRGIGVRRVSAQATLWSKSESNGSLEGKVLATKAGEVNRYVEELLGFQVEQFRQVMLIPQGQFRKLLVSDVRERGEILEALFRTDFYRHIETQLKHTARELQQRAEKLRSERENVLTHEGIQADAHIDEKLRELSDESHASKKKLEHLRKVQQIAQQRFSRAQKRSEEFLAYKLSGEELHALQEAVPNHEQQKKVLQRALSSERVLPSVVAFEKIQNEHKEIILEVEKTTRELASCETSVQGAASELRQLQIREKQVTQLREKLGRYRGLQSSFADLGQREIARKKITTNIDSVNKTRSKTEKTLVDLTQREEKLSSQLHELVTESSKRKEWERERNQLAEVQRKLQQFHKEGKRKTRLDQKLKKLKETLTSLEKRTHKKQQQLDKTRAAWETGQAIVMARSLKKGKPCPVCGSADHPQLASSRKAIPDEEDLQELSFQLDELDQQRAEKNDEYRETDRACIKTSERVKLLHDELEEFRDDSLSSIEQRLRVVGEKYTQARKALEKEKGTQAKLEDLREKKQKENKRLEELQGELQAQERLLSRCMGEIETLRKKLPTELKSEKQLQAAIKEIEKEIEVYEKRAAQLLRTQQTLHSQKSSLEGRAKTLKDRLSALDSQQERAEGKVRTALEQEGFSSVPEVKQATRAREELEKLEAHLQEFQQKLGSAKDRVQRLEETLRGKKEPTVKHDQQRLSGLEKLLHELIAQVEHLRANRERMQRLQHTLQGLDKEIHTLDARYEIAGTVADVAVGEKKNTRRMSFHTYVLAALLEDVLMAANQRLRKMSSQRYELQRCIDVPDRRLKAGLDLEVFDQYTGKGRAARTLSGGESFLASLALALGLADVVKAHSGGIEMDAMFIDEGFGALDSEALDSAVDTLIDLQRGGRLVGVISHVPELRERIDVRLEVTPRKEGSEAHFVLP